MYATQFHSRTGYSGVIKSLRTAGAPFVPGDPDALNPKYVTEFPADVRMFGLTFETRFAGGTAFGELTYRPNQPLQFNAADLLGAVLSPVAPTTLRSQERALPPGGTLSGFERHKNVQLQLGAVGQVAGVLPGATVNWGAEIVYKGVPDLPDPSVTRFGRVDVFGQGPVDGVCPAPAAPTQCTSDGYVSRHAFGYRLVVGARYANVAEGVDLVPSLLFGQDVSGWSGDTGDPRGPQARDRVVARELAQRIHRRHRVGADLGRHVQQPARSQRRAAVDRQTILTCAHTGWADCLGPTASPRERSVSAHRSGAHSAGPRPPLAL